METSILSLNDDCLFHIVSYIHDPYSFHSIILSCKRMNQVVTSMQNYWHSNIRQAMKEYPIKRVLVDMITCDEDSNNKLQLPTNLIRLFDNAIDMSFKKEHLTYSKLIDVWQKYGPVAAKLFTWIRHQSSSIENTNDAKEVYFHNLETTIHLPNSNQDMTITTRNTNWQDDRFLIHIYISLKCLPFDEEYHYTGLVQLLAENVTWENFLEDENVQSPMTEHLQRELGETSPFITTDFFIWFSLFLTSDKPFLEEDRYRFKDSLRNNKPSVEFFELLHHLEEERFKISVFELMTDPYRVDGTVKSLIDTLHGLAQNAETNVLETSKGNFQTLYPIMKDMCRYCPKRFLKSVLPVMIMRTRLGSKNESECLSSSIFDRDFERVLSFRLGGDVLKVFGKRTHHSDDIEYHIALKFVLPNEKVIKLETEKKSFYPIAYRRFMNLELHPFKKLLAIERLGPVTGLLQECINHSMQGEDVVPQIQHVFTAAYFLMALECRDAVEQFKSHSNDFKWYYNTNPSKLRTSCILA